MEAMWSNCSTRLHQWLEEQSSGKKGSLVLGGWAFLEASFWFIAPDFLLIPLGILHPNKVLRFSLIATLASFLGAVAYWFFCQGYPALSWEVLHHTPFVAERMLVFVQQTYDRFGVMGVLIQSVTFIPFKIWTVLAVRAEMAPAAFFPLVMLSRFVRLFLSAFVGGILGRVAGAALKKHFAWFLLVYSVGFLSLLYAIEG